MKIESNRPKTGVWGSAPEGDGEGGTTPHIAMIEVGLYFPNPDAHCDATRGLLCCHRTTATFRQPFAINFLSMHLLNLKFSMYLIWISYTSQITL